MNYLREIVAFNLLAELNGLSASEFRLWHVLMSIANTLGWRKTFTIANSRLQSMACLPSRTLYNARNALVQRGYIIVNAKGNGKAPAYSMVSLDKLTTSADLAHVMAQPMADVMAQPMADVMAQPMAPLNKPNETKPNKTKNAISAKTPTRHRYGEYSNVLLTDEELAKLKAEYPGDWEKLIQRLSGYMRSSGKGYKDHLATMRNWARKDGMNGRDGVVRGEDPREDSRTGVVVLDNGIVTERF